MHHVIIKNSRTKIILIILSLLIPQLTWGQTLEATQSQPTEITTPFNDVSPGYSHYIAIQYLKEHNLISGYEDGTFKPLQEINRAEALKILMKGIKGPETIRSEPMNFPDVKEDEWYFETINHAWNNYLIKGYPDKLFHPEKNINLAESLKIILNQEGSPVPNSVLTAPFSDVPVDSWYAPYAEVAKNRTIVQAFRTTGGINPSQNMSRGYFAELIYRMIRTKENISFTRASWYADFASSHIVYDQTGQPDPFTAAHKTLPFNTKVLVKALASGASVTVTINDRGPYVDGSDLDLSRSAFEKLAPPGAGIINVEYSIITENNTPSTQEPVYGF